MAKRLWCSTLEIKISVRSFAWHDLITFYRYRQQVVCTDCAQALTHGSPVGAMGFLARLNPSIGIYTCIRPASDDEPVLIGQMQYADGSRSAHIVFLLPDEGLNQPGITEVLDRLAVKAGSWGAFHLLAEVEESSCGLEGLRRAGFSVYAWQRIWKFTSKGGLPENRNGNGKAHGNHTPHPDAKTAGAHWRRAVGVDEVMIRNLYQSLVPPLVQSAEPLTLQRPLDWVYIQDGEILAYAEGTYGPQGIYLQPLIHPAIDNVRQVLGDLLEQQRNPSGRPIYVAIRSYQAWLDTVMGDLECEVAPRQALMVRHLVVKQRAALQIAPHSVLEKIAGETSVPLVHNATTTSKSL